MSEKREQERLERMEAYHRYLNCEDLPDDMDADERAKIERRRAKERERWIAAWERVKQGPSGTWVKCDVGLRELLPILRVMGGGGGCIYAVKDRIGLGTGWDPDPTKDQTCFPSIDTIALDTGYSKRAVKNALDDLRAIWLLSWQHQHNKAGDYSSNRYWTNGWFRYKDGKSENDEDE